MCTYKWGIKIENCILKIILFFLKHGVVINEENSNTIFPAKKYNLDRETERERLNDFNLI